MSQILTGGEPFLFPGNGIGCLLIHGFGSSPQEMRWLGECLSSAGYSVLCPRLFGHATTIKDMKRSRWTDWIAEVEDGLSLLSGICSQNFLIGLSMGAVIALTAGARYPVAGVVAMSTPYSLLPIPQLTKIGSLSWLLRPLSHLFHIIPTPLRMGYYNPRAAKEHLAYSAISVRAFAELIDLIAAMRQSLPELSEPVLLIHSRHDLGVPARNAELILHQLRTSDMQLLWLENSGHVIPCEPERERALQAIIDFIQHHSLAET